MTVGDITTRADIEALLRAFYTRVFNVGGRPSMSLSRPRGHARNRRVGSHGRTPSRGPQQCIPVGDLETLPALCPAQVRLG